MPTYEYACAACQHEFEAFQSMKDPALTKCPSCGEEKAKRQISRGTGFILKGGGWYSDLYASPSGNTKKAPEAAGSSSEGGASSGGDSASKGESKPSTSSGESSGGASATPAPAKPAAT